MFLGNGWTSNELGDMDLFAEGDELHMFYLELPSHDRVGHAVSRDGLRWTRLPHAIHTGEPGEFDDDEIWTMHVFKWKNRYYMLYTALCSQERGRLQRTALAVSDDLIKWTKADHNPVAAPDPRWYEADLKGSGRADWRDPFPWIEGDTIHGLICAHEKDGPFNRRGCVAHITSTDALHWRVEPPFYVTGNNTDFEVPTIIKIDGRYFLLGHHVYPSIDVYRVSDSIAGPWRRPANDWLLPAPNHAFAPTVLNGRHVVTNWVTANIDWPTGTTAGVTRIILPLKEAIATPEGELHLRSYQSGWDAIAAGPAQKLSIDTRPQNTYRGSWRSEGDAIIGECAPGMGLLRLCDTAADFIFEADIDPATAVDSGIVWRSDDTADQCTRVLLTPGRNTIALQRLTHRLNYNATGRGCDTLQSNHHAFTSGTGIGTKTLSLRVIAWGPYIEVSLNHRVLLSFATMSRRDGHLGLFIEDGAARFRNITLRKLAAPDDFKFES